MWTADAEARGRARVVEWRGLANINKQFQVPTLILDATLPSLEILNCYFPPMDLYDPIYRDRVKKIADVKIAMSPHTRIRQVLDAPTSSKKLKMEKHREELLRYILQRWMETGCNETLVVTQMEFQEWLKGKLPANIHVRHYNAIAGEDKFKNVRLQILIGRTQPPAKAPEALTAALTGREPKRMVVNPFMPSNWGYQPVQRVIKLADGSEVPVHGDKAVDATVEDVRWQICEAELLQALGRSRAIHRTAANPLDVDLLFNTAIGIVVDEAPSWCEPSLFIETAIDGWMLTAPVDMVQLKGDVWKNEKAAYRTLQEGVPQLPGFEPVYYQLIGPKMKQRLACFNSQRIADPRAWLEEKLGKLK
jgi:putative DNA primase/helicase